MIIIAEKMHFVIEGYMIDAECIKLLVVLLLWPNRGLLFIVPLSHGTVQYLIIL